MTQRRLPWSFYSTLLTFGVFFFCLNVYILTALFHHPYASPLWLVGMAVGLIGLLLSIRMVRIHQAEMIERKRAQRIEEFRRPDS